MSISENLNTVRTLDRVRDQLAQDVARYLEAGGEIVQVAPNVFGQQEGPMRHKETGAERRRRFNE